MKKERILRRQAFRQAFFPRSKRLREFPDTLGQLGRGHFILIHLKAESAFVDLNFGKIGFLGLGLESFS